SSPKWTRTPCPSLRTHHRRMGCQESDGDGRTLTMVDLDRDERKIDIHHIFPQKWCEDMSISPKIFNSIINKTAISYKANRMIGGKAPSKYLGQIQQHVQVQLDDASMNEVLHSHL